MTSSKVAGQVQDSEAKCASGDSPAFMQGWRRP